MFVLSRVKSGHISSSMRALPTKPQQLIDARHVAKLNQRKPRLQPHAWPIHIPVPLWALEPE